MINAKLEDLSRELWIRLRDNNQIVWTTKTGAHVPINQMSTEHLCNCIKMLEDKAITDAIKQQQLEIERENYEDGLSGDWEG